MSREKLERLKAFLISEGITEGSYDREAGGFFLTGAEGNSVLFTVKLPLGRSDESDFPEELKPYRMDSHELERMMNKGNTEKQTWEGADFEIALRQYVGKIMDQEPELVEIHRKALAGEPMPTLEEYKALHKRIFLEICARPQIAEWDKKLKEYYF